MGLLDALGSDEGLLGLALLSAGSAKPVRTGLGEGLLQGMQLVQQNRNAREDRAQRMRMQQMQEQAFQMQLEERKRAQEAQARRGQYLGALDANQGPPMEMTPAGALAAELSPQEISILAPQQADPMAGLAKIDPKDYTPESFQQFVQTRNPAMLRAAPKEQVPDDFQRALAAAGIDPSSPIAKKMAMDRLTKLSTHQPAVQNINYGTPMPAINPTTGKVELVRPDNKGGMSFTGIEPPPQNRDTKLPAEIQRMNIAADSMVSLLKDYEKWLASNNPRDPTVQMSPARRAEMQSLMKNIQLQYKELAALGALTGPDLALMEAALTDPFTFKGAWYGSGGLRAQIAQARNLVDVRRKAIGTSSGVQQPNVPTQAADSDPLGLRK